MTLRIIFDDMVQFLNKLYWLYYLITSIISSLNGILPFRVLVLLVPSSSALLNKDNLLFLHLFILNSESVALVVLHFIAILNNLIIICPLDKDTV